MDEEEMDELFERAEDAQDMLFDAVLPPEGWEQMSTNIDLAEDASKQVLIAEYEQRELDIVASVFLRPDLGEFQLQVFFDGSNQDVLSCHVGDTLSANVARALGADVETADYSQDLHPIEERMLKINSDNGIY